MSFIKASFGVEKMSVDIEMNLANRPKLQDFKNYNRSEAILKRLYSMLYEHGPGYGTFLSLPFDQLIEHGTGHLFKWRREDSTPEEIELRGRGCADPRAVAELANRGGYSAYVLHPGVAAYASNFVRPDLPLIYKIDGRLNQPDTASIQSIIGDVKDAVNLGASAIGTSLYPGSDMIREDMERVAAIVREAHANGLPAVVWAYARGKGVDNIKETLYWTSTACSLAASLGADIIKTKYPAPVTDKNRDEYFSYIQSQEKKVKGIEKYLELEPEKGEELSHEELVERITYLTDAAPESFIVVSGGPKIEGDAKEELVEQTKIVMEGGAEGRIIGRNFWGVSLEEALDLTAAVKEVMRDKRFRRPFSRGIFTYER
ncbi:Fructose-bisphosphate aldolase class 1 [Candidatus Methanoperedenaceae archaeon GB50]|nr:Fructose-bisphosphate aldolase class 1 [Candidatus Methanoperedenaceae archaeon GB50]CAD7780340.1 MAG: Fructose-bisphosphate aldolase class 1 [Candidatus Methanoperedenaceae archaeon GB50]